MIEEIIPDRKVPAGKRPPVGAAAEVEKCALRPCRQTREGSFGLETERSAASDPRDLGAQALRVGSAGSAPLDKGEKYGIMGETEEIPDSSFVPSCR